MVKTCFKCQQEKSIEEFYKHKQMADGHLNKCKDCTKKDVSDYRYNPETRPLVLLRDRIRGRSEEKKAISAKYRKSLSPEYRKQVLDRYSAKFPEKRKAHHAVSNAVRDKRITKMPCEVCGNLVVEAHHDDYSKPLDVRWLCKKHHMELHQKMDDVYMLLKSQDMSTLL